jgi:tetratricopeptide (TPR) repeat protein
MSRLDDLIAIAGKSKKPLPWYGLAMEYRSVGDVDKAIETFRKVHALDATYVAAYFMCGQVLAEQGRHDEARAELQRGIAMARQVGDGHALGEMQGLLDTLD